MGKQLGHLIRDTLEVEQMAVDVDDGSVGHECSSLMFKQAINWAVVTERRVD